MLLCCYYATITICCVAELIQTHIQERNLRNVHVHRLDATPLSFSHREHSRDFLITTPN